MSVSVRDATPDDSEALAPLLATLGYPIEARVIRERMATMLSADSTARVLVGVVDGRILGLGTLHVTPVLQRPTPVGRVTALAVLPAAQGTGVGRAIIDAAERHFAALGLRRIEITSGPSHVPAYDFYRHLGYEDFGLRFAKAIVPA